MASVLSSLVYARPVSCNRPEPSDCSRSARENRLKPNTFRLWHTEPTNLLPASASDWLSSDHHVYFLLDLVIELDLSQIL
jgi:hypothetical protein